jgi:hypothetical protein
MRSATSLRRSRSTVLLVGLAGAMALSLPGSAVAHDKFSFDHPADGFGSRDTRLFSTANSDTAGEGDNLGWEAITSIPTGNPHTDLDFFTQGGETYASVGTLGTGANGGGQSIIKLTETDENGVQTVDPSFFSAHPSAFCPSNPRSVLGLQHDVEATPKSADVVNNSSQKPDEAAAADVQLIVDATDASGRCHDQGVLGVSSAPQGGLEIVDVTNLEDPVEIGLTSHIGQSHTVNIDPRRPHIAYSVTSDQIGVTVNDNGTPDDTSDDTFTRDNESSGNTLDGFEVVDLSSCLAPPYGTLKVDESLEGDDLVAAKREQCRPETYRYRYPTVDMALGHTSERTIFGCHELEIYPDDRLTCGSGGALIVLDMEGAFVKDPETGLDKPNGTPLPCFARPSSTPRTTGYSTGATVMDCVNGGEDGSQSLTVSEFPEGNDSLKGVVHLGSVYHQGRGAGEYDVTEDIDFNHESELTLSGKNLIATDERGGGVVPPGATCSAGDLNQEGNGGVHAYQFDELRTERPVAATDEEEAEQAFEAYARGTDGEKAIFRAPIRTAAEATFCTAHVMQQAPGQNRIFMGWYTQGTQVVDYVELPGGVFEWVEDQDAQEETEGTEDEPGTRAQAETEQAGYLIPENANTWVSHVFRVEENEDGTFTYFGATGDFLLGEDGRNSIDIYKVTLPAPATACTLAPEATVEDRDLAREVHRPNVDCVLHYDIAKGTTDTTYSPTEDVTRAQMASFIARDIEAAGGTLPAAGSAGFSDIAGNTHEENIKRLAAAGIVGGKGDGRYDPAGKVTRDQMASFIVRAARFVTGEPYEASSTSNFSDVPASNVHRENINAGFEADLFRGTTAPTEGQPGTYSPNLTVQRDQMATFLVRLFTQTIQV